MLFTAALATNAAAPVHRTACMTRTIHDLTTAIASGDSEALAQFYREWFNVIFAEARRVVNDDEQFCLDIVQDTMMRVIRAMKPIEDEAGLRKWLRVVVQSCCYDELRRRKRQRRREQTPRESPSDSTINAVADDRLQWIRAQLAGLPHDEAHLLTLRFRFGWTLQRIGRALGLNPGAVDGRISRSVAALRRRAEEELHE